MSKYLKIIILLIVCNYGLNISAQNYNISSGGTISTCSGNFYDSGGAGGNYSNNEDYTITFCPSTAGQVIRITFTSFTTENWSATYDRLFVYDGNSTAAPLIGSYVGTGSPGTINVSASNTSGCITFRFRSDGGTFYSGWAATISCVAPPPPIINMANGSYTLCSASFYDNGGSGSNYSDNSTNTMVFCPSSAGQCIKASFTSFDLEDNFDYLSVFDGNSTAAPMILGSSFTASNPGTITATNINTTGCLTFKFYSDGATTASGWAANITCGACVATPTAGIQQDCNGSLTICSDQAVAGTSLGDGNYNDLNSGLGNLGCLNNYGATDDGSAEHQSTWYFFSPSASGTIGMTIAPTSSTTDYDWAIFGPYTNLPCPPSGLPLRCSASAPGNSAGGNTGLGNGATDTEEGTSGNGWVSTINVIAGQKYILFLDNWNATNAPFNLSWQLTNGATLGCGLLPIELLSFMASNKKDYNLITWITASENNNDYFTLERSIDGLNWKEIATIDGAGNSSKNISYNFKDYTFIGNELNYYRLKQTNFNKDFQYSPIKSVEASEKQKVHISDIYPNPSNQNINFSLYSSGPDNVEIQLIDFTGNDILKYMPKIAEGKNDLTIDISSLKNGIYLLKIICEQSEKNIIQKFIKN